MKGYYNTVEEFKRYYEGKPLSDLPDFLRESTEDTTYEEVKLMAISAPDSEDKWETIGGKNIANEEPEIQCPDCGQFMYTEWADNGFGLYSVQIAPYHCPDEACGWHQDMPFSHVHKSQRPIT